MPGCRAARLWLFYCLLFSLTSSLLFAQGARLTPSGVSEQEADQDNPAARDQWFMRGRVAPKGKTAAEMRWQAYQQKILMRVARMAAARQGTAAGASSANSASLAAVGTSWSPLGPAPLVSDPGTGQDYGFVSGRATSVLIDPADPTGNTVYLGGAYGGLWRTRNGANINASSVAWTPMIDNQPTLAVGAIAVQPGNATSGLSNTILVGTGEANSSADSYYGLGILRSIDAGANWTLITQDTLGRPFHGMAFSKIAFNTANPNIVVAATATSAPGILEGARTVDNRGVYVSTNAGQTWTYESSVKDGSTSINPLSNSVTSVIYNPAAAKFYAAFRYHGFYSSTDGMNWTRLPSQPATTGVGLNGATTCPATLVNPITCPIYRGEIAVVPGRNEMYVWYTDPNDGDQGIWKSINGGGAWTRITDTGVTICGDTAGCGTVQGAYDLELAALPNGTTSTDLYAGARNVYKCTITTASPTCSGAAPNKMMNLTHVYGCFGVGHATVHPDQHGLDAIVTPGGQAVMYFAHDGGINRTLDGFALTNSGSCTTLFDDLNGSLGSMTEFVSFSQDPANPAFLLGGTQDNGSPSTSLTNTNWHSVLGGDGGYNQIDPVLPNNWYTANTNVSIQLCNKGSACLENDFSTIVSNSTLGGDTGSFYTPYILDPQNTSTQTALLIGTCRIWRGSTASGFTAISPDFFGGSSLCSNSSDFVHALAAGGAKDSNGFSKVIYAGLDGTGPLAITPQGGDVWVTKDSGATWTKVTPSLANQFYTIGDIAIDSSDPTGNSAYVALQGFNSSHVLQTTDGGANWTALLSGALPNAPVNSLVVDPVAHILYAGTDVGVFSSPTTSPIWTEVGPAPAPGVTGYIPDAPVTRLRMFSKPGTKILRASTYGRGIWEFALVVTPDFSVTPATFTQTAYPGQTSALSGTLTAQNGYASPVNLTCTGTKPVTCAAATTPVTPTTGGAAFTVNAANPVTGDFAFNIHAAGTDSVPQIHDATATLHIVDFALGTLNPPAITVNVPNSMQVTVPITTSNNFSDSIAFTCTNAAPSVSCSFSPNPVVVTAGTTSTSTTLTVTALAPALPFGLIISADATAHPAPAPKTKSLSVIVTANPDYTLAISNSPQTKTVLGQATFNGTLTAVNSYASPVNLSCVAGTTSPPATCTVTTTPTTPTAGGAAFTVTAANTTVGTFNFNIQGVGTDGAATTHSKPVSFTANADFHVPATTTTCTPVTAGGTSTCSIAIGPDGQATFANTVTYPCPTTGFPNLSSCSFNPTTITAGSAATTVTLSIHTTAAVASLRPSGPFKPSGPLFAFWLSLPAMGIVAMSAQKRRKRGWAILSSALLLMALLASLAACGGGGSSPQPQPGTTPGTYTFNVNVVSGGITHSAPMSLKVN